MNAILKDMADRRRLLAMTSIHPGRLAIALLIIGAAMALRGALNPWFANNLPFLFALPALFFIGWIAGFIVGTVCVAVAVVWLFVPWLLPTLDLSAGWRPVLYFLPSALMVCYLGSRIKQYFNPPRQAEPVSSPVSWLIAVMSLAIAVPLITFLVLAEHSYAQHISQAHERVERAVRVGEEQALKIFEANDLLLNRILDNLGDESDAALLSRENQVHIFLKRLGVDLPQVQGIFIFNSVGRMVATNRAFPAPYQIDFSDRPWFVHHRSNGAQPYISQVLTSRVTGQTFFDVSLRRTRSDGSFAGTVSVSLLPNYFHEFYKRITNGREDIAIQLRHSNGSLLAGWPVEPVSGDAPAAKPLVSQASGTGRSFQTSANLAKYGLAIDASLDAAQTLTNWYGQIALLLALIFPIAGALVIVGLAALTHTRQTIKALQDLQAEQTTRQQVEEALLHAQKLEAMGRLTGGVAHDFNNLLAVISNNTHLLKRQLTAEKAAGPLTAIERSVSAGAQLTRQLLSFSRRQPLRSQTIRLQQWLPITCELIRPVLGASIRFELDIDPSVPPINVDTSELELALLNLSVNAKDAMPAEGQLCLSARAAADGQHALAGGAVLIAMQDTGQGIAPEVIERVFEPFFTTKPVGLGTGLGLSQVYSFCKRAGGTVMLTSAPGTGTTVTMVIPAANTNELAIAQTKPSYAELDLAGIRVLLVDDNPEVAAATRAVLEAAGATVHQAIDADAAMSMLREWQGAFDLMISDIVMPGAMDGVALAQWVRIQFPNLAVLLMTGYSQRLDEATRLKLDVLPKPSDPLVLLAAIRQMVAPGMAHLSNGK